MKMIILGAGSAFTVNSFNSNFLLEGDEGNNLLIDCGSDIKWSLRKSNKTAKDIDSIFISHLHGDHCGGLEYIGFLKYFDPSQTKPKLYISKLLVNELWQMLSPAMSSYEGKILTLNDYFEVYAIEPNGYFIHDCVKYQLIQTLHIMDGFRIVPSFGLMFKYMDTNYYFTSDTQFTTSLKKFYDQSDIIFQECETANYKSNVHCHYTDLKELPSKTKKKMYLYHYNDNLLENSDFFAELSTEFKGVLTIGNNIVF